MALSRSHRAADVAGIGHDEDQGSRTCELSEIAIFQSRFSRNFEVEKRMKGTEHEA
jgi:hypothetical protein